MILIGCIVYGVAFSCKRATDHTSSIDCALDSLFTSLFPEPSEPGAIVLVAKGDSIICDRAYGMADLERDIPMTDTAMLNICSISKQFSAVALLKLEEDGRLELDDPIVKFVPALQSPQFRKITLEHLLSHTSGIPDTRPRTDEEWRRYISKHESRFSNCREYKLYSLTGESTRYLNDLDTFAFEPGTAYEYQNPTYQLVSRIVEDAGREHFVPWMEKNIFAPAGLEHTVYFAPSKDQSKFAHAYTPAEGENIYHYWRSDDGRWEECDYGEADFFPTKADGGVYTTALDFLKWTKALFGGKVIGDSALAKAITPVVATDIPDTSYGLGFFIERRQGKPRKIFHTGDNGGFLTVEAYFPEADVFYLIFANRPDWPRERTYEQVDSILIANNIL